MKWKSSENRPSDLNGFLDAGSQLEGELRFETSFRVDGRFTGTVVSDGDLMVGAGGEVEGEIRVGRVFVSGTIHGNIEARQKVQIAPGGKVFADLATPALVIEDGGVFEGRCAMTREEEAVEAVPAPMLVAQATAR